MMSQYCTLSPGGSWIEGSGSAPQYNAESDVGLVKDVVVVTINYRLGVFGFLGSGCLRSEVNPPHSEPLQSMHCDR